LFEVESWNEQNDGNDGNDGKGNLGKIPSYLDIAHLRLEVKMS